MRLSIRCAVTFYSFGNGVNYTWQKTLRRVQETLSNDGESDHVDPDNMSSAAAFALKQKRLTFTWLDGEVQQVISYSSSLIFFY